MNDGFSPHSCQWKVLAVLLSGAEDASQPVLKIQKTRWHSINSTQVGKMNKLKQQSYDETEGNKILY